MSSSRTLLLVEDEPHLREAVAKLLRHAGWEVLVAGNGTEALQIAGRHLEVAVLVTDIRLPDMYGRRLAHRVAEVRGDTAGPLGVVFVSGNLQETSDDAPLGARERFVAKPFDLAELLARIAEVSS